MPRFTVDTFQPGKIPDLLRLREMNLDDAIADGLKRAVVESVALRSSIAQEVGAGGTILEALRDFAEIGWQEEPDTLLKTVVWVRDERGRIVGVGYYWVPSFDNPYIQVDRWPILSVQFSGGGLWSFYRVPDGDSYKFRCSQVR